VTWCVPGRNSVRALSAPVRSPRLPSPAKHFVSWSLPPCHRCFLDRRRAATSSYARRWPRGYRSHFLYIRASAPLLVRRQRTIPSGDQPKLPGFPPTVRTVWAPLPFHLTLAQFVPRFLPTRRAAISAFSTDGTADALETWAFLFFGWNSRC